jgi:hypothetical protein
VEAQCRMRSGTGGAPIAKGEYLIMAASTGIRETNRTKYAELVRIIQAMLERDPNHRSVLTIACGGEPPSCTGRVLAWLARPLAGTGPKSIDQGARESR